MAHPWIDLGNGFKMRLEVQTVFIAGRRGGVRVPLSTWRECVMRVEDQAAAASEEAPDRDAEAPDSTPGDSDPTPSENPDAPNGDDNDEPEGGFPSDP